jgi:ABC-2 type transport system ATP-binding protein
LPANGPARVPAEVTKGRRAHSWAVMSSRATGVGPSAGHVATGAVARDAVWCSGLSKSYGQRAALRSVSLRISAGEAVGLLGPNGAGKSTLVKMLVGLVRPDTGEGLVLGAPLGRPKARRDIGYLPELFRYQPWLTVTEVLEVHARLRPVPSADRAGEVRRVLARAGLADRGPDRVGNLSKGLQQRLGLAVALLGKPRLLLLDEPTSALDPTGRADVRSLIEECREEGTTVLLNSHMLSEVERSCDRVIVLDRGRVLADGPLGAWLDHDMLRVRLDNEASPFVPCLARFGAVSAHARELTVASLPMSAVPDAVAALVRAGARVVSVEPGQVSLEEKLLELLARSNEEDR